MFLALKNASKQLMDQVTSIPIQDFFKLKELWYSLEYERLYYFDKGRNEVICVPFSCLDDRQIDTVIKEFKETTQNIQLSKMPDLKEMDYCELLLKGIDGAKLRNRDRCGGHPECEKAVELYTELRKRYGLKILRKRCRVIKETMWNPKAGADINPENRMDPSHAPQITQSFQGSQIPQLHEILRPSADIDEISFIVDTEMNSFCLQNFF